MSLPILGQEKGTITKNEAKLTWIGKAATGGYSPEGTLDILAAEILMAEENVTSLYITVDMRSLYHDNKQLKKHLRGKDFFEVKKFPVATFVLKEAAIIENNKTTFIGEMTIKGNRQEEAIPVEISHNDELITIQFEHTLDRTQYGVVFNSPSVFTSMKENLIDDIFELKGTLVFRK